MAINYPEMVLQPLQYVGMFLQGSKNFLYRLGTKKNSIICIKSNLYLRIKILCHVITSKYTNI